MRSSNWHEQQNQTINYSMRRDGLEVSTHCTRSGLPSQLAVVSDLEYLEAGGNGKAWSYMVSIQRFGFIITLVAIEHVHQSLLPLITFL